MAFLNDYHVHTDNSMDCKFPMATMCEQALQAGVREIAFTDHLNHHLLDLDLGFYRADKYFADVEACRARYPDLKILAGIELGEPHRWWKRIAPIVDNYPYDLILGSVHWVGKESMFDANYYRGREPQQAYHEYFEEVVQMVNHGGFDILAHVDLPKRTAYGIYGAFDAAALEDDFRAVWQACIDNYITPEINTKSLRLSVAEAHPNMDALRWYVEMGGKRLTFGSDAHTPDSIGSGMGEARRIALGAGLHYICHFEGRRIIQWSPL